MTKKAKKQSRKESPKRTRLGGALRALGSIGGGAIGSLIGHPGGGAGIGHGLGAALSKWLGSGDYQVRGNTLVSRMKSSGSIPMMHQQGQSIIVRHKEYIGDIKAGSGTPTAFNVFKAYYLNPGLADSFPWLSTIAQNFQEYSWKGMVYHYVPTSGDSVASTNTSLGSVMIATRYRSTAGAFTSKQLMLNEYFASDAKPSEAFCHPIECDPRENPYNVQYIRTGAVPTGEDGKTYDLGVMSVATQGMPGASTNVGELWVTYEVELRKPIAIGQLQHDSQWYTEARTAVAPTTAPFGATAGTPQGDGFTVTGTSIAWPAGSIGKYIVNLYYIGGAITGLAAQTLTPTSCTVFNDGPVGATLTATGGYYVYTALVVVPDANAIASITCSSVTFAGTVASVIVRIYEVNNNIP